MEFHKLCALEASWKFYSLLFKLNTSLSVVLQCRLPRSNGYCDTTSLSLKDFTKHKCTPPFILNLGT